MALSNDDWELAQTWIGTKESRADFTARYERLGEDLDAAIHESMTAQLSAMIFERDAQVQVEDIQVNNSTNIRELSKLLEKFTAVGGTSPGDGSPGGMQTTRLARRRYR